MVHSPGVNRTLTRTRRLSGDDHPMSDVLFVCVHNAGRSQMARAIFDRQAQARGLPFRAASAGTAPATQVHAVVADIMQEQGFDLSAEQPQLLDNEMVDRARRVVTMGCAVDAATCPSLFIKDVVDWGLPDPAGRPASAVRSIRDEIAERVDRLLEELASELNHQS